VSESVLSVVGVNYRSAPVELREKIVISDQQLPAALETLGHGVILSTCNRIEVYQVSDAPALQSAADFLGERCANVDPEAHPHFYHLLGADAARHLYDVAAGLDSMVLGEPQILGQIRAALEAAEEAGTAGPVLSHVFRDGIRVGRRARAETFIGRHAVSISYAAVELAKNIFGKLQGCRALVVGAGEMGELTVKTLVDHGVGTVAVVNRTLENATALARRFDGEAASLDDLVTALEASDIVISSTDAPDYVIRQCDVQQAVRRREGRPLFMIDIAVPRDIDPAVRGLSDVFLYDIDDLQTLCEMNREQRRREAQRVRRIIEDETTRFARWWRSRQVIPTVVALRRQAEQARQEELAEAMAKLEHLSDVDQAVVADLSRAIVQKLLHQPTVRLKGLAGDELADGSTLDLAQALFGLSSSPRTLPDLGK